ncbi:hypothetical protein [Pseudomonas sp. SWRI99]|uniref:hypothetical protein n=1 Tax=Pseudomonas sp. SWRI99 TaxID=2745506 RepID=UPI0016496603|nr:hypothetical protein [Pseudomonas sp. SWRI99]MBC3775328.1 hypothetical protein [Pseudomonas sp. SWRI99]
MTINGYDPACVTGSARGGLPEEHSTMPQAMLIHCLTPQVTAFDPRRLTIRAVDYWRQDSRPAQARINRVAHDSLGRMTAQWDPRFAQAVQPNVVTVNSLSAKVTGKLSVDAGWRVGL